MSVYWIAKHVAHPGFWTVPHSLAVLWCCTGLAPGTLDDTNGDAATAGAGTLATAAADGPSNAITPATATLRHASLTTIRLPAS